MYGKWVLSLLIIVVVTTMVLSRGLSEQPAIDIAIEPAADTETSNLQTVSARLLVVGDLFWGRHIEYLSERSEAGYGWPYSGFVDELERSEYQAWIANVECPVTNADYSYSFQIEQTIFNCRPEYLGEFAELFDVASLANNHTDNVGGAAGLIESRQHLASAGVQHFGHFDFNVSNDICEVISLDVKVENEKSGRLPFAFCGVNGVYASPSRDDVAVIADYAAHFPTIVMPHMGQEYRAGSDPEREALYRHFIDLGADAVLGGHPHWVQNTESYKGKLIAYSLGNFIFDQAFSGEVSRGIGIELRLSAPLDDTVKAHRSLADDCIEFKDNCLERAKQLDLEKPSLNWEYELHAFEATNYLTSRASQATADALLQRTNWQQTISGLH